MALWNHILQGDRPLVLTRCAPHERQFRTLQAHLSNDERLQPQSEPFPQPHEIPGPYSFPKDLKFLLTLAIQAWDEQSWMPDSEEALSRVQCRIVLQYHYTETRDNQQQASFAVPRKLR